MCEQCVIWQVFKCYWKLLFLQKYRQILVCFLISVAWGLCFPPSLSPSLSSFPFWEFSHFKRLSMYFTKCILLRSRWVPFSSSDHSAGPLHIHSDTASSCAQCILDIPSTLCSRPHPSHLQWLGISEVTSTSGRGGSSHGWVRWRCLSKARPPLS